MTGVVTSWIARMAEFRSKDEADLLPKGTRGIYVLYRRRPRRGSFDVVYVGLSKTGIRVRLRSHRRSRMKGSLWTHFSVFQVHDNVSNTQINELEGLFRHIYRRDSRANKLNRQKTHGPLRRVRIDNFADWPRGGSTTSPNKRMQLTKPAQAMELRS